MIALPEDAQADEADVPDAAPYHPAQASPAADDVDRALELLAGAERPLLVVGGGGWSEQAGRDVIAFAEASNVPVVASFRRQDYVDNASPAYAGPLTIGIDPKLAAAREGRRRDPRARHAPRRDRHAAVLAARRPRGRAQTLIHVHADPDELGRVYEADLPIVSGSPQFAAMLRPVDGAARGRLGRVRRAPTTWRTCRHDPLPGDVQLGDVMAYLRERLPGRRGDHERRRQLHRVGAPLLRVPPLRHAARPVRGRDGLRRAGRDRREAASTRSAPSSASPATATS